METDNTNPLPDSELPPPVSRMLGLAVSEWVVYGFVVVTVIAVIVGFYVGGERDAQAERAMATLATLKEEAEKRMAAGSAFSCDNTLLDSKLLANDYLNLSIGQAPINEEDKSLGYGPALYISVVEEEVSGDTWDTAKRLRDLVKEAGKEKSNTDEVNESSERPPVGENVGTDEDKEDDMDKETKNALRNVSKTGFGEDKEYLRYYILASEVALCSQGT